MAAISLPPPGTALGPCPEPCEHTDCAETRRIAESRCTRCEDPIGYERAFYHDAEHDGFIHAVCLELETRFARGRAAS
jgi:hypothetical protein